MKKIALLTTGGTIASQQDPTTGLMLAGKQTGQELLAQCNLTHLEQAGISVDVHSLFQVPSSQMTFERCLEILVHMHKLAPDTDGFVVTHGTDTLEESAYFLAQYAPVEKTLVLTGAQQSPTERNSDAFHNIASAIRVAANDVTRKAGPCVVFNDRIFAARHVTKIHSSNINGFASPRSGPLGIVDLDRVHYFHLPLHCDRYPLPDGPLKKVEIITACMGMDPGIIDYHVAQGTAGLIIAGFGRGHVDPQTAGYIKKALEKGVYVVMTTACSDGEVAEVYTFPGSVHDLVQHGAINGRDHAAKKARIKLMALLTQGASKEVIQEAFDRD